MWVECFEKDARFDGAETESLVEQLLAHVRANHDVPYPDEEIRLWARNFVEQTELLDYVTNLRPTVLVVSHFNKAGRFAGPVGNEYDADATVIVKPNRVEVTKCRWSLCPRSIARPRPDA